MDRRRELARRRSRAQARHLRARYRRVRLGDAVRPGRESTLLALVQEIQQRVENDTDVVRLVRWLVNHRRVVLNGNFAGQRF